VWRIYYGDGSVYSDQDGLSFDAPTTNVQVIWCELPGCSGLLHKRDYYWWDQDCWWAGDEAGLWQYRFKPGPKRELYGTTIATVDYDAILKQAINDRQAWLAERE
jgi:hypothetical protein